LKINKLSATETKIVALQKMPVARKKILNERSLKILCCEEAVFKPGAMSYLKVREKVLRLIEKLL
jgi:hypothetical protein